MILIIDIKKKQKHEYKNYFVVHHSDQKSCITYLLNFLDFTKTNTDKKLGKNTG
jgi:hypothetical protein